MEVESMFGEILFCIFILDVLYTIICLLLYPAAILCLKLEGAAKIRLSSCLTLRAVKHKAALI